MNKQIPTSKFKFAAVAVLFFFCFNLSAADRYWVGGTGNWTDGSHWAGFSGGGGGSTVPTSADNVYFDANSFSTTSIVTIDAAASCNNMDWTGALNTPVLAGIYPLNIYGSLTFISNMGFTQNGGVFFKANTSGNTITTAGRNFNFNVYFEGTGADWTLTDGLTIASIYGVILKEGYLITNGQTITATSFDATTTSLPRGLYLGNSSIYLSGSNPTVAWNTSIAAGFSLDAGTSTLYFTGTGSARLMGGAANIYNNVVFQDGVTGSGSLESGGAFNVVTFNGSASIQAPSATFTKAVFMKNMSTFANGTYDTLQLTGGYTCTLMGAGTQNINKLIVQGTSCSNLIAFQSHSAGNQATINATSPLTAISYATLKDIKVIGSTPLVANNSQDFGNNTGVTINAPASQNLYWVGGSGNWNDAAHWSLTQGGAGGACVPTSADNVFFTTGSFTAGSKTVTMNVAAYCKNMTWTGAQFTPVFTGTTDLNIYGSLTLISAMNFTGYTGKVYFKATTTGNTITSAGKVFANNVYFDGTGGWILQDAFSNVGYVLYLVKGTLNTNSKNVITGDFYCNDVYTRTLVLGSSNFTLNGTLWASNSASLTLNAGTSTIIFTNTLSPMTLNGGGYTFHNIVFQSSVRAGNVSGNGIYNNITFNGLNSIITGGTVNKLDFRSSGFLNAPGTYDTLLFAPSFNYQIQLGTTQTVNSYLGAIGTSGNMINIYSSANGNTATLSMNGCNVCTDYLSLKDIHAVGTASFYAANSTNNGNTTGWNFAACPSSTLSVGPITGPAATCINGTNYTYSVPVVSGADSYVWTVPSGATILSGQNTNTIYVSVGSTAGTVSVTVTACGNTASASKAITVNPNPTITNISVTPATCSNADGTATATVSGGTPTYYYRWSSADTLATAPALMAGQYQLLVFDIYGCRATANTTIVASNGPQITVVSTTPNSCNGGANATASISVTGGTTPYQILWSNGATSLSTTGLLAGPYEVTVTDTNNCSASQSITITEPSALSNTFTITPSACAGATGSAQANVTGGTGAYTYAWDGSAANQTTQLASNLAAGVYQVIVTDANSCSKTFNATVPNTATTLASSTSGVIAGDCGPNSAGSATLDATGGVGAYTYLWSNGATTATISGVQPGNYYVTVTDASLCSSSQSVTIPSSVGNITQAICMVTVDTSTFTNQVIWEKLITNDIQSFKIYRESNIQNVYTAIATVPFTAISEYTDLVANPAVHAWRYKITAVDSCGVETPYSAPHKTIHLAQNLGVGGEINLAWDQYEGFPYYSYYIWRHDPSTGWVSLDTLSTNYTTYTDFVPPSVDSRYMIEVRPQAGCNSTLRPAGGGKDEIQTVVVKSKSNIKNQRTTNPNGIKEVSTHLLNVRVYPNPANDLINIEIPGLKETATIEITNLLGQTVHSIETTKGSAIISVDNLENGLYLVKVRTTKGTSVQKVIVK